MHPNNTKVIEDAIETLCVLYTKLDNIHTALGDSLEEMPEDDDDLREPLERQVDYLGDACSFVDQAEMALAKVLE